MRKYSIIESRGGLSKHFDRSNKLSKEENFKKNITCIKKREILRGIVSFEISEML